MNSLDAAAAAHFGLNDQARPGTSAVDSSLSASLWTAAQGLKREAQFVGGSVVGAAEESVNSTTAVDCAKSVAIGATLAVLDRRYIPTTVIKYGAGVALATMLADQVMDRQKWDKTLAAGRDVWNSDKNITANIAVGKDSIGRLTVDTAVMAVGMYGGAKIARALYPPAGATATVAVAESGVPRYRYFEQSRGGPPDLYRFPANGRSLEMQNIPDVHRFDKNGIWRTNERPALMNEWLKGWFDEAADEVSEKRALELISRFGRK